MTQLVPAGPPWTGEGLRTSRLLPRVDCLGREPGGGTTHPAQQSPPPTTDGQEDEK